MWPDRTAKVDRMLSLYILCEWGRGGVNEIEWAVKSAKAGEAQSWHEAGNEHFFFFFGGGGPLPGSVFLLE